MSETVNKVSSVYVEERDQGEQETEDTHYMVEYVPRGSDGKGVHGASHDLKRLEDVAADEAQHSGCDSTKSHYEQEIIIENSAEPNIIGFDPPLLRHVKEALANADGQHSFVIVNQGEDAEEAGNEQTTYIIDLSSLGKETVNNAVSQSSSSDSNLGHASPALSLGRIKTISTASFPHSSALSSSAITSESKLSTVDLVDPQGLPSTLGALDYQEQVEISYVSSSPSHSDLSNPTSETHVVPLYVAVKDMIPKNLSETSHYMSSQLPHTQTMTTVCSSYSTIPSLIPLSTSTKTEAIIRNPPSDTLKESHRPAEYLLHMAKKMIEENSQGKKLTTRQHPGLTVTPPELEITEEKCGAESVITMYLSSPSELQEKIQTLKTNSPVIVMQAGDNLLVNKSSESGTHTDYDDSGNERKTVVLKSDDNTTSSEVGSTSEASSDGFVSALSSMTASGVVYRCAECGYSSHNKHYYKQHVDLVHNEDRPYKCPHCDYAGKRRHALLEHMVVHSNQRPFTCDHCNASFRKKGHLTNHIKLHTSQKLVHCGVCHIQLPDTEAFESHLRKIHNTDKLYKCKLCDHTVVDRDSMLRHLSSHNETVIYSCPKCPNLFNDEDTLVSHMKNVHNVMFVEGSSVTVSQAGSSSTGNSHTVDSVSKSHSTSIMCSECGFVCGEPKVMQRHMWVHIGQSEKQKAQTDDKIKISPGSKEDSSGSTMGVLKMNVDLGQKTLPKNVVYQCTSCSFTSSDNSVFIKHMLAHKTQEKRQRFAETEHAYNADGHSSTDEKVTSTPTQSVQKLGPNSDKANTAGGQTRLETGVPFVYDKASARFRCIICGYHCEFQRTIKAHIWKHSGHQSIEYPTFDRPSHTKASSGTPVIHILASKGFPKPADQVSSSREKVIATSASASNQQNLPMLRTRTGDTVQLVPVNPLKTNYNPGEIIQIKDNSVIVPVEYGGTSTASRLLESIAFSTAAPNKKPKVPDTTTTVSSSSSSGHTMHVKEGISSGTHSSHTEITTTTSSDLTHFQKPEDEGAPDIKDDGNIKHDDKQEGTDGTGKQDEDTADDIAEEDDTRSSCEVYVKCSEPSVVVEVVDTVPSGSGFTGMKSQQGSPRVLDLDIPGELKPLKAHKKRRASADSDTVLSESEKAGVEKGSKRTVQSQGIDPSKNHHSYSARLRCPICDCVLAEDFKTHLMNCQKKVGEEKTPNLKQENTLPKPAKKHAGEAFNHDDAEHPQTEDTDSTESLDELTNSSGSSSQQKHGICSSLLAVIEQLRERSRSESEDDKQGIQSARKGTKKRTRQEEEDDLESIDDLQNIEKITESGSEKFRCSLCHYTSHRICNIKLHMKTHRQKKPSECSLCDFSSTSSEALQDHMLKHCKVRTYACKFCPQSFNHKSTLRAHLRAHKDQEPFLCAYCVFETTNPMEYREHMQVHSGCSSRLRCPGCDLILANKEELTSHLLKCKGSPKRTKPQPDTKEKPKISVEDEYDKTEDDSPSEGSPQHACVVQGCSFSSSNLKELQDHLSIHCNPSLLVCNLCDFKALHSRSLKSHMKRHANDQRYVQQPLEQYKCNLCGYVCHHLPSLKSHMWRHASDQSYSYEFTNDVINAAIDHDTRVDADGEADDPELLDRVINSERKILEGELTKCSKGDGQRPICWVTFRCCSCGFETINKAKLNIHMRTHSDIIQKTLDVPRKSLNYPVTKSILSTLPASHGASKRSALLETTSPAVPMKVLKAEEVVQM